MEYNNPFMKFLETIANMLIVSFLWLVFSLPVITIVPACAAIYHTTSKVVFGKGNGNGVFRDFFDCYKLNLVPGIKLSLIMIVAGLFVAEGLYTGYQIYKIGILGMLYMGLGIIIALFVTTGAIYVAPVLSRIDAPISSLLRLSMYLNMTSLLRGIIYVALLGVMAFFVEMFPLALLIVPGLYADLIRPSMEKALTRFIEDNGLEDTVRETEEAEEEKVEEQSVVDMEKQFAQKRRKGKN